jgi:surface antigen
MKRLLVLSLAALLVAGCEATTGHKEEIGGVLGAAGGGLLGAQVGHGSGQLAATAAGAVIGMLVGSSIGRSMDEVDRMKQQQAAYAALERAPSGTSTTWHNPDSGDSGSVTPTRTYQQPNGTYCREYQQTVTIGGKTQQAYGTACRQPDGTWKVVS